MASMADGWDDDDDLLDLDESENDEGDGWSFDDNIMDDTPAKNNNATTTTTTTTPSNNKLAAVVDTPATTNNNQSNHWSFDDDDLLEPTTPNDASSKHPSEPSQEEQEALDTLVSYLESLPRMMPSVNAVLEAEYNTPTHAMELVAYYKERPQLYNYTIETELPRMEYQIMLEDHILRDKQDVAAYLLQQQQDDDDSVVLVRSANQSLLADLLACMTGDMIPSWASAVAQSCQFTLHSTEVVCTCELIISIPDTQGRLDVAQVNATVQFDACTTIPSSPQVHYKLHHVELLVPLLDAHYELQSAATVFVEMHLLMDNFNNNNQIQQQNDDNKNLDVWRDAFLSKMTRTRQLAHATNTGFQSALKEIGSVANVGSKLERIKAAVSLPSENDIREASSTRLPPQSTTSSRLTAPPPPPQARQAAPSAQQQDRPAPILGGLLMSGLSRLAKSVTLPEEDQALYQEQPASGAAAAAPQLYRKPSEEQQPTTPQLYRKTPEEQPTTAAAAPQLYRKTPVEQQQQQQRKPPPPPPPKAAQTKRRPPPPPPPRKSGIPRLHRKNDETAPPAVPPKEVFPPAAVDKQPISVPKQPPPPPPPQVQDGWDDDDDLADLDDIINDDDIVEPAPVVSEPKQASAISNQEPQHPLDLYSTIPYNKEHDIVETRQRWVNPSLRGAKIQT